MLVRVHYLGYPTHWLKLLGMSHLDYQATLIRPINRIWHPTQGYPAPAGLDNQTWVPAHLEGTSHVNIVVFTSYHGHPYRRTDIAFKPGSNRAIMLDRGHECLLLMMVYDSTGRWDKVRQDQPSTSWDILVLQWSICLVIPRCWSPGQRPDRSHRREIMNG
jgi:hypothetical protein